jgi:hypothetical protein
MSNILPYKLAKEYTGTHRGVSWSIRNWSFSGQEPFDKWNYYIYLHLNRFKDQELASKFWCKDNQYDWGTVADYYNVPIIHSIDFHGGVTLYEKQPRSDASGNIVKIGCDYSHFFDEGRNYRLEDILYDTKATIDNFHSCCEYYIWCQLKGDLYMESQGTYTHAGVFRSNESEVPAVTRQSIIANLQTPKNNEQ